MFGLPNLLTATNLLSGIAAIYVAMQGRLDLTVYFLLFAMLLDFLDGFVARALHQQGELGKQLDSLADMVSFGVAPGAVAFVLFIVSGAVEFTGSLTQSLLMPTMGESIKLLVELYFKHLLYAPGPNDPILFQGWTLVLPFVSFFIPFFSLFRLAKFNLDTRQSEQFIGLPTPANTLFILGIALTLWFGYQSDSVGALLAEILVREQVFMSLVVIFSVLLIAEIPLIALKFKSFSLRENWEKFALLAGSLILIVGLTQFALPFIVLLSHILSTVHFIIKKSN